MNNGTIEVELQFPDGSKTINMNRKNPLEINGCEIGRIICLLIKNGEEITGIFKGMDKETIMIESLSGKHCLGYKTDWVSSYLEEQQKS